MSLYYNLSNNIQAERLIKDISKLIQDFSNSGGDLKNSILCVTISNVYDNIGDSLLPKLEHHSLT